MKKGLRHSVANGVIAAEMTAPGATAAVVTLAIQTAFKHHSNWVRVYRLYNTRVKSIYMGWKAREFFPPVVSRCFFNTLLLKLIQFNAVLLKWVDFNRVGAGVVFPPPDLCSRCKSIRRLTSLSRELKLGPSALTQTACKLAWIRPVQLKKPRFCWIRAQIRIYSSGRWDTLRYCCYRLPTGSHWMKCEPEMQWGGKCAITVCAVPPDVTYVMCMHNI